MTRMTYVAEPYEHIVMRDGVVVVAVDEDDRVALIRQRLPLHGEALSVPGGMVEDGEDPETSAHRELREEVGLTAKSLCLVGSFVPMPRSTQRLHLFEARGLTLGDPDLTPDEIAQGLSLEWLPVDQAIEAVHDGRVQLSGSALALLAYLARRSPVMV